MTILSIGLFIKAANSSFETAQIDAATRNLMIALLDAETGQRGYLITNDMVYLTPYEAGSTLAQARLDQLKHLSINTSQAKLVDDIEVIVQQKLKELAFVMEIRRDKGFDAASHEIDTHIGKNLMDSFRRDIDQIQIWAANRYDFYKNQTIILGRIGFFSMIGTFCFGFFFAQHITDRKEEVE